LDIPGAELGEHQSELDNDTIHAEAFRDLEGRISDCVIMAEIAAQMAGPELEGRDDKKEMALFSAIQVVRMLRKLQKDYAAVYEGKNNAAIAEPS
jgi:hypothetical protein